MIEQSTTIVAAVTPPVSSGVGILRLSGPAALRVASKLAPGVPSLPAPRHAYFTAFTDVAGEVLDEGLLLYFQAPHSFTGEEVVELQTHGSPRLLEILLGALLSSPEVRPAQPGEFSRRAFMNGRLDLARAEAIADLVSADSELAVRAAASQLRGGLSRRLQSVRDPILGLQTELEGVLNFPDEADDFDSSWSSRLEEAEKSLCALLSEERQGRLIRRGARVVLFGPVNAGKSTLFNRLVGEDRALVDAFPGTTRDLVEARWELLGCSVTLVDTAGLREGAERVEALGIERTRRALLGADLAILILPRGTPEAELRGWEDQASGSRCLRVVSKCDLGPAREWEAGLLGVNGVTGDGVKEVETVVGRCLGLDSLYASGQVGERHADALRRALGHLERAREATANSTLEVVAGEVGLAAEAVGEVTGENASEALLDAVFRRFCVGK